MFIVLLAKFGIVITTCMNYAAHPLIFPTLFSTTSMGYLLMITYTFSSVSQFLTEIKEPFPMILFSCFSAVGALAAFFLRPMQKHQSKQLQEEEPGVEDETTPLQESFKVGIFQKSE